MFYIGTHPFARLRIRKRLAAAWREPAHVQIPVELAERARLALNGQISPLLVPDRVLPVFRELDDALFRALAEIDRGGDK